LIDIDFIIILIFEGEWALALGIYNQILSENPANIMALKRIVSVHRSANEIPKTIESLHNLLKLFPNDYTSWVELAEIHLSLSDYEVRTKDLSFSIV
jgi:predicted Zn-dependent protease